MHDAIKPVLAAPFFMTAKEIRAKSTN